MRWTLLAMLTGITLALPNTSSAQRRPPAVVEFGVPSTGEVHRGRLVQWEYWGLTVESCKREGNVVTCRLNVGNGSGEPHTLCLGDASLVSERHPNGLPMMRVQGTPADARAPACQAIAAHEGLVAAYQVRVPAGELSRSSLRIAITERVPRDGKADSTLRARANIPIVDSVRQP